MLCFAPARRSESKSSSLEVCPPGHSTVTPAVICYPSRTRAARTKLMRLPPKANTTGRAWESAINKLRSHQADLHVRADDAAKLDWNAQFNAAWQSLVPARQPATESAPPPTVSELARLAIRIQRERPRGSPSPCNRNRLPPPPIEASPESMQRFNRFWDSLAAACQGLALPGQVCSAVSKALPRSLSLVPIEVPPAISADARALSLLRAGRDQHPG